jgi:DNA primase
MDQFKKKETLFGFNLARQEIISTKSIVLCEGNLDAIAWHQAGVSRAVATLGTAFSEEHASLIRPLAQTVYLCFDSDAAGQTATYKAILVCRKLGFDVRIIEIKNGKDPSDFLNNEGSDALKSLLECSIIDLDYLVKTAGMRFDMENPKGKPRARPLCFHT